MSDSNPKHESGLSDMASNALDAILNRDKDDDSATNKKDSSSSSSGTSIGHKESGEGRASDILSAGTQNAARSVSQPEPTMGAGSHYDTSNTRGVEESSAPTGRTNSAASDAADVNMGGGSHYDTSNTRGAGAASTAVTGGTSSAASDAPDVNMGGGSHYDTSNTRAEAAEEEPFVGSGGVGSAEFMEALRKGHEAAGGEYTSDLSDPNKRDDGPTGV